MLDNETETTIADSAAGTPAADDATGTVASQDADPPPTPRRRRAAGRAAGPPSPAESSPEAAAPARERTAAAEAESGDTAAEDAAPARPKRARKKAAPADPPAEGTEATSAKPRRSRKKAAAPAGPPRTAAEEPADEQASSEAKEPVTAEDDDSAADSADAPAAAPTMLLFQAPPVQPAPTAEAEEDPTPRRRSRRRSAEAAEDSAAGDTGEGTAEPAATKAGRDGAGDSPAADGSENDSAEDTATDGDAGEGDDAEDQTGDGGATRRRRRRGGRGRRGRGAKAEDEETSEEQPAAETAGSGDAGGTGADEDGETASGSRRRRRRRRRGEDGDAGGDDPENTVTRVRSPRSRGSDNDEVSSLRGSTRLEAKKQRRREGREAGRRRVPIITEAEFLARREAVDRVMVVRQGTERTQIAVLEDGVLVEHYVNKVSSSSLMGDVFLGRVQNVLPSMEAAFVDIGKGRNAVLYAGEVNFEGLEGQPKRIEHALKSGQSVLVQVTKDPVGHKGARLTSQVTLPGRYLVYVPEGSMTGISRKLPDTERSRLKSILKKVVPEDAGVIIRTAAEGASEEELARDVERLSAQWAAIQKKAKTASAPALLHGEPDLTIRVVRDIFNSDFGSLVVAGDEAWSEVSEYVEAAAPDLVERMSRWTDEQDVFAAHRIDEQISKALDRKVWLPSGGSLVIDRTEAMTVVDVNTGKFTGQGGNLEETVTRNNLEAAEEIVRQLRLRDIGGIIVVDFIDMVLESNRELVLRRLVECLGRDRTKHQVAEVTSLGLVQMTRKRVGQGLLEAFSSGCENCGGRGIVVRTDDQGGARSTPKPGPPKPGPPDGGSSGGGRSRSGRRRRGRGGDGNETTPAPAGASAEDIEIEPMSVTASTDDPDAGKPDGENTADKTPERESAEDTSAEDTSAEDASSGSDGDGDTAEASPGGVDQAVSDESASTPPDSDGAGDGVGDDAGDEEGEPAPKRRRRRASSPAMAPAST